MKKKKYYLSASLICADFLRLEKELKQLIKGNIDFIHIDVMDGVFVPRYGLFPEILSKVKKITNIPMDVHMMVSDPEKYINDFAKAGADYYCVHPENNPHIHRIIKKIKLAGMKPGIVLNPATPLNILDYILDDIYLIMLMAINPGIVGHKLIPQTYQKIAQVKEKAKKYPQMLIEIDGGVTLDSSPKMIKAGANMLVCGTGTIFQPPSSINKKIKHLRKIIDNSLK